MESSTNTEVVTMGIPPFITTTTTTTEENSDEEGSLEGLFNSLQLAITSSSSYEKPNVDKDASTAGETYPESSTDRSGSDDDDDDDDDDNDDNDDDDNDDDDNDDNDDDDNQSTSSNAAQSHHTNDSTRHLLLQAQRRLRRQSIYEEVKTLRSRVERLNRTSERTSHRNDELRSEVATLERELRRAHDGIQSFKGREARMVDERAERERDFMNQLNDACSSMECTERTLMEEIMKRDMKIIELQNLWNEEEVRRVRLARERREGSVHGGSGSVLGSGFVAPSVMETSTRNDSEENWNDESIIGQFI